MSEHQLVAAPTGGRPPRAVLRRSCACGAGAASMSGRCPDCERKKLQAQLVVGGAQDAEEREADRVADTVMGGGGAAMAGAPLRALVQRSAATTSLAANEPAAPALVDRVLARPGQALDRDARRFMESRFGHDFGGVRVHADAEAAASARAVNANAYTVGHHLVFAASRYAPSTAPGRRLLAHELTHVVQQSGAGVLRRDLATPPPAVAPREQAELTDEQIQAAIRFNRHRYNEANTRLIQNLLGGDVTGTWNEDNIRAIAATQREYGLTSDGKVGDETFRFLNNEQRLEKMSTRTADCLTAFQVDNFGATPIVRDAASNTCTLSGHFRTASQFSSRCGCGDFEYRQFIRGHFLHNRGAVQVADIGTDNSASLPAGALTANFEEDGDVNDAVAVNYGHRDDPAQNTPENRYIDGRGNDDQAAGCRYRNEDFPGFVNVGRGIPDCQVGDVMDVDMNFRGEIQRRGAAIQSKQWAALRGRFVVR